MLGLLLDLMLTLLPSQDEGAIAITRAGGAGLTVARGEAPFDQPITAYVISSKQRYDQERVDLLGSLGASSVRIAPVFAEEGCDGSKDPMKKSVKGILLAHKAAWNLIAASGKRGLVLESDWGIGNQEVPQLRKSLIQAFKRSDAYTSVGWCRPGGTADAWKFGCTTGYFINPGVARQLNASSACIAVDALFGGLCKGRSGIQGKTGVKVHGNCCWWPGAAYPGYEQQMRGLFQQDRDLYASTHAAGPDDHAGSTGFSAIGGKLEMESDSIDGATMNTSQLTFLRNLHWGKLKEPALCV
jgi:hypothetical protein